MRKITTDGKVPFRKPAPPEVKAWILENIEREKVSRETMRYPKKPWYRRSKYDLYLRCLQFYFPAASEKKQEYIARVLDAC